MYNQSGRGRRKPRARTVAAAIAAVGGAALLGAVWLQPQGKAAVPGWEPVNARVEASLDGLTAAQLAAAGLADGAPASKAASSAEKARNAASAEQTEGASASGSSAAAGQGGTPASPGEQGTAIAAAAPSDPAAVLPGAATAVAPPDSAVVLPSTATAAVAPSGAAPASAYDASGKLDLNAATAEELDRLKGIGPAKAKAIVEDRAQNGPFRSVDDLRRVKGIGAKLLEGIRGDVRV